MKITILIATHKKYTMPKDAMYLPIYVGKEISSIALPYCTDNTGEHISEKNPYYCELTALYWAWKNLKSDYIGMVHYRRYFVKKKPIPFIKDKFSYVLTEKQLKPLLKNSDILLPKQRNYYIETNYSHYVHAHPAESIDKTKIIKYIYSILIIVISFLIFNSNTTTEIVNSLKNMFFINNIDLIDNTTIYYLKSYLILLIISIISATPLIKNILNKLKNTKVKILIDILEPLTYLILVILSTSFLIDESFNPFLYFRF